ncbi:MAG: alpha/beta hydrolase-fold protein [Alistipes indistinctus]
MGGHGALYLALRHPETFGACGSMSGGVELCPSRKTGTSKSASAPTATIRSGGKSIR